MDRLTAKLTGAGAAGRNKKQADESPCVRVEREVRRDLDRKEIQS